MFYLKADWLLTSLQRGMESCKCWWVRRWTIGPEPQVKQVRDRYGVRHWQVYDPVTQRSQQLHSEAEVRQWLERRYYP
jgi:hypothetical protein